MPDSRILDETGDGQLFHPMSLGSVKDRLTAMALSALSSRALVWVVALGACAVWGWTVVHPNWIGIAASVGYCATTLVPILVRDAKGA